MKNILFIFIIILGGFLSRSTGQNLTFSYNVVNSGTTSKVKIFAQNNSSTTPEPLFSFNAYLYFDNAETTLVNWDNTPLATLGWMPDFATIYVTANNATVPITHTGRSEYNVYDAGLQGAVIPANSGPVLLLEVNFNNTVGTADGGFVYMASTAANHHPPLQYSSLTTQFPIVVTGNPAGLPLPVELMHFDVDALQQEIRLNWQSQTATHFHGYEIERSEDGLSFVRIGFTKGKEEADAGASYFFYDKNVRKEVNYYYRLKMLDIDGNYTYSNIEQTKIEGTATPKLYPNPADDQIVIDWQDLSPDHIVVFDMEGREVLSQSGAELSFFDISQLASGHYQVRAMSGKLEVANLKFIKK